MKSEIRTMIARLQEVARSHMAYSQVADVIENMVNHLSARARIEEMQSAENVVIEHRAPNKLTLGRFASDIEALARTYDNYFYATNPERGQLRIHIKNDNGADSTIGVNLYEA